MNNWVFHATIKKNKLYTHETPVRSKLWLILLALFLGLQSVSLAQTSYYLSSAGSDMNSGLSESLPWKTLDKVNQQMAGLKTGDVIRFKRGETFFGTLQLTKNGLQIGAYGTGERPVLSGGKNISNGWILSSGKIWERQLSLSESPDKITNFYKAETRLPIGRYPNLNDAEKGYLRFESKNGTTQITDNELNGSVNWVGSEVVIKVYEYRFCKTKVTGQSGKTLTLASSAEIPDLTAGSGYFFVNSIKTLDKEGEWAYDADSHKLYLYADNDPNSSTYTYTYENSVISITNAADVTLSDLSVKLGKNTNILLTAANNALLKNLSVNDAGGMGIQIEKTSGATVSDCSFDRNNVRAIYCLNQSSNLTVRDNQFTNIGMDAAFGKEKGLYAIYNESDGAKFLNNRFENIGGAAICTGGKNQLIRRNFINQALMLLDDMGGIYTNDNLGGLTVEGTVIEENIVTNCPGEPFSNATNHNWTHGIYLDNYSSSVTVRNNSVANIGACCYFMHRPTKTIKFYGNTGFNGNKYEMQINISLCDREQFLVDFHDNILATNSTANNHYIFQYVSGCLSFDKSGYYANNCFVTPFKDEKIYLRNFGGSTTATITYNVDQLNANRSNVSNFSGTPVVFSPATFDGSKDILFQFNDTQAVKNFSLPAGVKFVDTKGKLYSGTLSLEPFSSVLLLRVIETTGFQDENKVDLSMLQVFPNPSDNLIQIKGSGLQAIKGPLLITSMDGRVICCEHLANNGTIFINIQPLPPGIYLLKLPVDKGFKVLKFVKV
jgi:hypothetical protein